MSHGRWWIAGAAAAGLTLGALASSPVLGSSAKDRYDVSGALVMHGPATDEAEPFVDDSVLDQYVVPAQLKAVPVGSGAVAEPVKMVLAGAPVIRTLDQSGIPDVAVRAYKQAEARLAVSDPRCGVPWTLLAAIGRVESDHGRFGGAQLRSDGSATRRIRGIPLDGRANVALIRDTDGGVLDGDTVYDRAVGPMQFIPSTWRSIHADANGDGFADPNNIFDAAQGAAQYLCAAASDLRDPSHAAQAVRRYNNADSYVRVVLALAAMYQSGQVATLPTTGDLLPNEPAGPPVRRWPANPTTDNPWTTPLQSWSSNPTQEPSPTKPIAKQPSTTTQPPAARPHQPVPSTPDRTQTRHPEPTRPSHSVPATTPRPQPTQPPKPHPTQPPTPKPSHPTQPVEPNPSQPNPTQTVQPKPSEPRPTQTVAPKPTQTVEPKPTEPRPTQTDQPKPTQTAEPKPSDPTQTPKPSEPTETVKPKPSESTQTPKASEPSRSASPTPAPSADTPSEQPTTAAIGWAPAMRQAVGQTLAQACHQPQAPHPGKHPKTCRDDSTKPARDPKNPEHKNPQHDNPGRGNP